MPSHDAEEFGGELYHDIIARIERSWGLWLAALAAVERTHPDARKLTLEEIQATDAGDREAVDVIRQVLEGDGPGVGRHAPGPVPDRDEDPGVAMKREHERLLGAIEAASQASDETLEQVRERIGPITWKRYEQRTTRLRSRLGRSST